MKKNKAFKFRLKPNEEQRIYFAKCFGCTRFIYNKMLADKKEHYEATKTTLHNTPAQYKDEFDFLKEVDSLALANTQLQLETAFRNFFRDPKVGYPKFKSKKHDKKTYTTNNLKIHNQSIILPKIGKVHMIMHRQIPKGYILKSATISQVPSGKYYISILTEYEDNQEIILDKSKAIGLDYSNPDFYVDDQNRKPEVPKYFRQYEELLAKEQRKLSRMKLHSCNYEKQKIKVAKIHEKISNSRKNWIHNLSKTLTNEYDIICIEDINLRDMSQTLHLAKNLEDNGFGIFKAQLDYKAKKLIKIDKWYPSSKTCNECGFIYKDLSLGESKWICPQCGSLINRDQNAAKNILRKGLSLV